MADNYGQWFITKMFTDAEAAAVTSGKQITFKKMIASQDIFTQDDLATLTNSVLGTIDIKQQVNISTVLPSTGSYKVQGVFSNSTVTADYLMNTILLVGSYNGAEFLAAAQVANNAFKMPAASTGEQTIYTIAAQISVSNTATVSLTVDPDSIVTNAGLKVVTDAQAVKDSAQDVKISDLETNDSQNVKIAGNQTIDGFKSFTQKVTASISGNAGTATKLETPRKIDGKDFDGSQDVVLDVVHKTGDEEILGSKSFEEIKINGKTIIDLLHPVGSYYITNDSTNPSEVFGLGTWVRVKGRVLVGVDENDSTLSLPNKTGGSTNPLTSHTHDFNRSGARAILSGGTPTFENQIAAVTSGGYWASAAVGTIQSSGDNTNHTNWQPFQTAYMWYRSA